MSTLNNEAKGCSQVGAGINFADPNSPLARFYLRAGDILAVAIISAVFLILNHAKLWHTDIWGHLRYGEYVLDNRNFPTHDPFCNSADPNCGRIDLAWLSQVTLAATLRAGKWLAGGDELQQLAGGVNALRFLLAVLVTLRLGLLYFAFVRLTHSRTLASLGLLFIVAVSLGNLGVIRPQVFAELLFATLIYVLSRQVLGLRDLIVIPMILVAWCNFHGSFPVGCFAVAAMWMAKFLRIAFGPSPRLQIVRDLRFRRLTLILMFSIAAITVLNPDGWHIWSKTVAMANHPVVRAMDEWQPLWSPLAANGRIIYLLCLLLILLAILLDRGRISALAITFLISFAIPPLLSQRATMWFIAVAPWIALPSFGRAVARHRPNWWRGVPSFRKTLVAAAFLLVALMWSIPIQSMIDRKPPELSRIVSDGTALEYAYAVHDPRLVPESVLSKVLKQHYPEGRFTGTIYSDETLGDFFVWKLTPPVPIFIYSHVHLFTLNHWQRYVTIRDAKSGWREELDRANVNLIAVVPRDKPLLCKQLRQDSGWKVIIDESSYSTKIDPRCRHFVALRVSPVSNRPSDQVR